MKTKLSLLFLCLAFLAGCKDDDDDAPTVPSGLIYSYYPNQVGREMIYDVSIITKDEFSGLHDTSLFQMKEVIASSDTDNQGRLTERLERFIRASELDPWSAQPAQVWTSNLTTNHLERKEENITYVKLAFPILNSMTWNGNVYNILDAQTYRYRDIHMAGNVNSLSFDSTLTVLQNDEDNFIERKYEVEKFANHIGLYYKEHNYIKKDYTIPSQPGIKAQRLYKQTLVSYTN